MDSKIIIWTTIGQRIIILSTFFPINYTYLEGAWVEVVSPYLEQCPLFKARKEENHEKFQVG